MSYIPTIRSTIRTVLAGTLAIAFLLVLDDCSAQDQTRVWSDNTGTFSVEAKLLGVNSDSVTLRKLNGVVINVPINKLSKLDTNVLNRRNQKTLLASNSENDQNVLRTQRPTTSYPDLRRSNQATPSSQSTIPTTQAIARASFDAEVSLPLNQPNTPPTSLSNSQNSNTLRPQVIEAQASKVESEVQTITANPLRQTNPQDDAFFSAVDSAQRRIPEPQAVSKPEPLTVVSKSSSAARTKQPFPPNSKDRKGAFKDQGNGIVSLNMRATSGSAQFKKLSSLQKRWPQSANSDLIQTVYDALSSGDASSKIIAIDLLSRHDSANSLTALLKATDDTDFEVRWAAFDSLRKIRDPRCIQPLAAKLVEENAEQAAAVLESFGTRAEPMVVPLTSNESPKVQMTVCSLLAKVGAKESLGPLQRVADETPSIKVRMQANNAINAIKDRLGMTKTVVR